MEIILGMIIILVFFGAIVAAFVQIARGRFKIDYDKIAQEAMQKHLEAKKQRP